MREDGGPALGPGPGIPRPGGIPFDAVVLAGGRARRLDGASKPDVVLAGRRLIDRTLDATAGARAVVVVGPPEVAPPGVRVTREDPAGGGPVAGLASGLAALPDGAALVLVLACDLPRVAGAVPALLAAAGRAPDGAVLVDRDGRRQPLAAVYRRTALDGALDHVQADRGLQGASMRSLLAQMTVVEVPDSGGHGADVDTWSDVAAWSEVPAWSDGSGAPEADPARGTMTTSAPGGARWEVLMTPSETNAPGGLDAWLAALAEELGLEPGPYDVTGLLDVARDVAHGVARPAAPLSLFLVGLAAQRAGGTAADVEAACRTASDLAGRWGAGSGAGEGDR